jgi:type III secretion protein L
MSQTTSKKILKSSEYQDILNAKQTVLQANITAKKIIAAAEQTRQSAYKKGYLQGLEQAQLDSFKQTANLITESIAYLGKIENDITNIILTAIKKIIDSYEPDEIAIQSIKLRVQELAASKQITLRAAPALARALSYRLPEIEHKDQHINLIADERLDNYQCALESELGIVHLNVDDMIDKLEQLISSHLHATPATKRFTQ